MSTIKRSLLCLSMLLSLAILPFSTLAAATPAETDTLIARGGGGGHGGGGHGGGGHGSWGGGGHGGDWGGHGSHGNWDHHGNWNGGYGWGGGYYGGGVIIAPGYGGYYNNYSYPYDSSYYNNGYYNNGYYNNSYYPQ